MPSTGGEWRDRLRSARSTRSCASAADVWPDHDHEDRRGSIAGVLVCNTTAHHRTVGLDVPEAWFAEPIATERTYRAGHMSYENRPWRLPAPDEQRRTFGPVDLAPGQWRILPLGGLPAPDFPGQPTHEVIRQATDARELNFATAVHRVASTGRIESPFHVLVYDQESGRITSLVDCATGREILRPRPGMDLFSYVLERPDPLVDGSRRAYYRSDLDREKRDESCWEPWVPLREPAERVVDYRVEERPGQVTAGWCWIASVSAQRSIREPCWDTCPRITAQPGCSGVHGRLSSSPLPI